MAKTPGFWPDVEKQGGGYFLQRGGGIFARNPTDSHVEGRRTTAVVEAGSGDFDASHKEMSRREDRSLNISTHFPPSDSPSSRDLKHILRKNQFLKVSGRPFRVVERHTG